MVLGENMLISICIPCHGRTYDLKKSLPHLIKAANFSPPVEIVVVDYNSPDDLAEYVFRVMDTAEFVGGSRLTYRKYAGRDHYHMAHARNLSVLASSGEWIVTGSTDIFPAEMYFQVVRDAIQEDDYLWMRHPDRFVGMFLCKREEFLAAGGYDERFEFYGKEDKDIIARMMRRGGNYTTLSSSLLTNIPTSKVEKFKNYRLQLSRREISVRSKVIWEENNANAALVANEGKEWGAWGEAR